jgi:putative transposase
VIEEKSVSLDRPVHALNSCADHVHVAVSVHPKIAVSDWVRQVKGASTHTINETFADLNEHFYWQEGFGVLTFGAKQLPYVTEYIVHQKVHHQARTTQAYLERDQE